MISHGDRPYDVNSKLNDFEKLTDIYKDYKPAKTQKHTPKVDTNWINKPLRYSESDLDQMREHEGSECEY